MHKEGKEREEGRESSREGWRREGGRKEGRESRREGLRKEGGAGREGREREGMGGREGEREQVGQLLTVVIVFF